MRQPCASELPILASMPGFGKIDLPGDAPIAGEGLTTSQWRNRSARYDLPPTPVTAGCRIGSSGQVETTISVARRMGTMEYIIGKVPQDYEHGKMTRRQLIQTLALTATAASAGGAVTQAASPANAIAINHVSMQVANYAKTRDFYAGVLGMTVSDDKKNQCLCPARIESGVRAG